MEENQLVIDLLYIDSTTCNRCSSTNETLDKALRETRKQIHEKGVTKITVNKIKVKTDKQAKKHDLVRSPTLRINGKDIEKIIHGKNEIKDSYCPSCHDIETKECKEVTGEENKCRTVKYKGKTYETVPKQMIEEAIRKVVGIETQESSCCESSTQTSTCCEC